MVILWDLFLLLSKVGELIKEGIIYIIRNKVNDKVYIGQTTQSLEDRWKQHLKPSTQKQKGKYKLYNAINKYGKEMFYIELLEDSIPVDDLNQKEIDYIELYDSYYNGYNSTKGADGRVINNEYDIDDIVELFKQGVTPKEIAKTYEVSSTTICRLLRKEGYDTSIKWVDMDYVLANYKTMSYDEIGAKFGVDGATIKRRLHSSDIHKRRKYINSYEFDYESFKEDWLGGMSVKQLSIKYDLSKTSVYRTIKKIK